MCSVNEMKSLYWAFLLLGPVACLKPPPAGTYPEEKFQCLFDKFKIAYNKTYKTEAEEKQRYEIFVNKLREINEKNAKSFETVQFGINTFTDLTHDELNLHGCSTYNEDIESLEEMPVSMLQSDDTLLMSPTLGNYSNYTYLDWRNKNVVTEVKDQLDCGSCWAFSLVGCIESLYAIEYGVRPARSFSKQQLVDCTSNTSCQGGNLKKGIKYIMDDSHGLNYEEDYPYVAQKRNCEAKPEKYVVTVIGSYRLPKSEDAIFDAVRKFGPVPIAMNVNKLHGYTGGIWDGDTCEDRLTHAVLIVGYGIERGVNYWIIKNSWGASFGEDGYFRIVRGKGICMLGRLAAMPRIRKI